MATVATGMPIGSLSSCSKNDFVTKQTSTIITKFNYARLLCRHPMLAASHIKDSLLSACSLKIVLP